MVRGPQRVVVAINPTAAFGRNKSVGSAVIERVREAGHEAVELVRPDFSSLLAASHEAVARRPDAFVVVGGDGMVNLGANVTARTGVPLGIVPAGTGNDMARALGIPHEDPDAATRVLLEALSAEPIEIDAGLIRFTDDETGLAGERWFACSLSAGFDALVNERANRLRFPSGASRYVVALFVELARLRRIAYEITLDGVSERTDAALVSVGNGVSLGGGMKITPDAMLDDGRFDVLVVQPLTRFAFLRIFPRVFSGTHVTDPRVRVERVSRIRLDSPGVTAYADGERIATLPVDIEAVAGALQVLAPQPGFDAPIVIARP
jgi:diacylglycerol kinase (ATP)